MLNWKKINEGDLYGKLYEKAALNIISGKLFLLLFFLFQLLFMAFISLGWSIFRDTTSAHNVRHDSYMLEIIQTLSGAAFFQLGEVSFELKNFVESKTLEGQTRQDLLAALEQEVLFLARMNSLYDQIRLFDQAGIEIFRVENRDNKQIIIGQDLLEDISSRPYFEKIIQLEPDEYYFSRPEVMTDNGVPILPNRMVIQTFFPVTNLLTEERFGYIHINFNADPLFSEIKSNLNMASGEIHILGADGTWMFSRAPNEDFEAHIGQEISFKNYYPETWSRVQGQEKGILNLPGEIVVFDKILVTPILEGQGIKTPGLSISTMNQRFLDSFYLVSKITVPSYATLFRISPEQTFLIWGGYIVFTLLLSFWIAYLVAAKTALQERVRYSLKMEAVGELTSGIAHDFNNLLTAVIGNLGLLEREKQSKTGQTLIDNACDAAWRGAELTKRLLAFSRKQNLEPKDLDLAVLLQECKPLLEATLGEGLLLKLDLSKEKMMVRLDPLEFQNVVLNLAINARDSMATGDRLEISIDREVFNTETAKNIEITPGPFIVTRITDTGKGMAPEVLKQAIDPFFTTKPIGEGSGLGLSMAYGFARQSGGQMKIISKVGKGTTILILLPEIE